MREVYPNLFVGGEQDFPQVHNAIGWAIVQACKEPFHREALGYKTRGAPKDHPEYLVARRGQRLILNLVDIDKDRYQFIPDEPLDKAVEFVYNSLETGLKVLIHCNMGASRGPSIALLYLLTHTDFAEDATSFGEAETEFRKVYPDYFPAGIREKVREHFIK